MRLAIIANPKSGRGRAYRRLQEIVRRWPHRDWLVEVHTTPGPGQARFLSAGLLSDPPDLLAVCGGDGTFNEVVNGLPDPPCPVAVIPAGTANVLANEIGMPMDTGGAIRAALEMHVKRVDLCRLDGSESRHFMLMAGAGYDAYVVARTPAALKERFGIAAFYLSTIQCLATYPFPALTVTADGGSFPCSVCVVANSRGYGGGLLLTPEADMSDGILDIVAVGGRSRLKFALFALSAWWRRPRHFPWVRYVSAKHARIEGPAGVPVQVDGELVSTLPVEISLVSRTFPLVVPVAPGISTPSQ